MRIRSSSRPFLAFATVPTLRALRPPDYAHFQLAHGYDPKRILLIDSIESATRPFHECPESRLPQLPFETLEEADDRRKTIYQQAKEDKIEVLVDTLIKQWPCRDISMPIGNDCDLYFSIDQTTRAANAWFRSWYHNAEFRAYIRQAQHILDGLHAPAQNLQYYSVSIPKRDCQPKRTPASDRSFFAQARSLAHFTTLRGPS